MKILKSLFAFTILSVSFLACEPEELPESNEPQLQNIDPVSENGEEHMEDDRRDPED